MNLSFVKAIPDAYLPFVLLFFFTKSFWYISIEKPGPVLLNFLAPFSKTTV
jgi:hypothetical protein